MKKGTRTFQALGRTFQLEPYHENTCRFGECGVHEMLCQVVEHCWLAFPVDFIYSIAEDRDMVLYSEVCINFPPHDMDPDNHEMLLYLFERSARVRIADYREFIRAFVPAALPISRFGPEQFQREIPEHIRRLYSL